MGGSELFFKEPRITSGLLTAQLWAQGQQQVPDISSRQGTFTHPLYPLLSTRSLWKNIKKESMWLWTMLMKKYITEEQLALKSVTRLLRLAPHWMQVEVSASFTALSALPPHEQPQSEQVWMHRDDFVPEIMRAAESSDTYTPKQHVLPWWIMHWARNICKFQVINSFCS